MATHYQVAKVHLSRISPWICDKCVELFWIVDRFVGFYGLIFAWPEKLGFGLKALWQGL